MNSFSSRSVLRVGKREFEIYRLDALEKQGCAVAHLPYSLRILLENLLRREDGKAVKADDIRAARRMDGQDRSRAGDCVHAQPRTVAGFYRRARGG